MHLGLLEFAAWLYMIWYIFRAMRNVYQQQSRGLTLAKYLAHRARLFLDQLLLVLLLTAIYSALTRLTYPTEPSR